MIIKILWVILKIIVALFIVAIFIGIFFGDTVIGWLSDRWDIIWSNFNA